MTKLRSSALAVFLLWIATSITAPAQTFSLLYDFGNKSGDPLNPTYEGIIAQGRDANLYSTTPNVESSANGTMFEITPTGTLSVPYSFTNGNLPESGLTLGTDGNFYGTTNQGGNGYGGVFKITPSGTITPLYTFTDGNNGGAPKAPPIEGTDGNFYGTTTTGGANNRGTVYKITPSGKLTTLYAFDYTHGADAIAPFVLGTDGNFYGVTFEGGSSGSGLVYKITPSGKLTLTSTGPPTELHLTPVWCWQTTATSTVWHRREAIRPIARPAVGRSFRSARRASFRSCITSTTQPAHSPT